MFWFVSDNQHVNQVVMWDKIVQHPSEAKISLNNVFNKYMLVDQYDELRGTGLNYITQLPDMLNVVLYVVCQQI